MKEGSFSQFLRQAFSPPAAGPPAPADAETPLSPCDLGRVLTALRKGWVSHEQVQSALNTCPDDDALLKQLCDDGALDEAKLALLFGSSLVVASKEALRNQVAQEADPQPLGGYQRGDVIGGRYRILEIKRGGFGVVYICESLLHRGQRVALKAVLRQHMATPQAMEMFCLEAAHWISLGAHPNIVLAHGVTAHARMRLILMEYIEDAKTLADEIFAGTTDWRRALTVGIDVARALAYAHQQSGLVHGDLKPLNLLVDQAGTIKVTDFGLSVCQQAFSESDDARVLVGTEGFIAPEMYRGRTGRTTASDVYAFGVVLFQTATRRMPFRLRQSPPANLLAPAPDPRHYVPEIPAEMATLILACLQAKPELRPAGFDDITRQLEKMHLTLLGCEPALAPAPGVPAQADALVNLSQSWYLLGKLDLAERSARQAIRLKEANWKAHYALGKALGALGDAARDYRPALAALARAQELAPAELAPVVDAAYVSHVSGNRPAAIQFLEKALRICQARHSFSGLDARLLADLLQPDTALSFLDKILEEEPDQAMAWNERISVLRRLRRFSEALDSAERVIQFNPVYAEAWKKKAIVLMEMKRFDEALVSVQRALDLEPRLAEGYAVKATALAQTKRLEEARRCVAQGLVKLPGHPLLLQAQQMFSAEKVVFLP